MNNCLIIDSNKSFASKLYSALMGETINLSINFLDSSEYSEMGKLCEEISAKRQTDTIILINAEAKLQSGFLQYQELIEAAFWLRCKHKLLNPIVFYSIQSLNQLLRRNPKHSILLSPGCYHLRIPFGNKEVKKIAEFKPLQKPLENFNALKPYLKPRISLEKTRHKFANYAGMSLMLAVAKGKHHLSDDTAVLVEDEEYNYKHLRDFKGSLDYHLLKSYYDLNFKGLSKGVNESFTPSDYKILLIDDLAKEGWQPILSRMIYGEPGNCKITALTTPNLDEINSSITEHKPHLILLDLRLNDERGKKDLETLGGFKLLKHIKTHPKFKGLPVIMFTASTNAESTKKMLESGAEAVWTKPGIDENLSQTQIIDRYEQLLSYVTKVFKKYDQRLINDSQESFDGIRRELLEITEFVKYRASLSDLKLQAHYFNQYTDIFVDANIALDGPEALCDIYKLAQICGMTTHKIIINNKSPKVVLGPKVVFVNFVVDEIIKWSKVSDATKPDLWKSGLLGFEIIKTLFEEKLVRTEYDPIVAGDDPRDWSQLKKPSSKTYADPVLVSEINNIISRRPYHISDVADARSVKVNNNQGRQINVCYATEKINVLLITNENPRLKDRIPYKLWSKIFPYLNNDNTKYNVIDSKNFHSYIEGIVL